MMRFHSVHVLSWLVAATFLVSPGTADAYRFYAGGCDGAGCHGGFTGGTSPRGTVFPGGDKHQMHRAAAEMDIDCLLCHTSSGDNPEIGSSGQSPFLGCMGCHGREEDAGNDSVSNGLGAGLRQHHYNAGETGCAACHTDADPANYTPVGEDVFPAYYGTDVPNVDEPCNGTAADQTNENWTNESPLVFIGLDNDGDGLYDGDDPDCGGGPVCGDGTVDPPETCDDGPGSPTPCPDCVDGDPCTTDEMTGSAATCDVVCANDPIDTCIDSDGCCPLTCDASTDNDCPDVCGDGVCTGSEDNGNCPADCPLCDADGICETGETVCGCPLDNCPAAPGDGCCSAGEDACSDPVDCPVSCGDGCCSPSEDCAGCVADCGCTPPATCVGGVCTGCGNGTCDSGLGEDCSTCADDCACDLPLTCVGGVCTGCGDGTCAETAAENCSNCTADCDCLALEYCDTDLTPPACAPRCGDGTCEGTADENCNSCTADCECAATEYCDTDLSPPACALLCGDGECDQDEDCAGCPEDCGACPDAGADMAAEDGAVSADGGADASLDAEGPEGCSCELGARGRGALGIGWLAVILLFARWRRRRPAGVRSVRP